ncbi:hypothetical protein CICLE_v10033988mg [Citrus x clementina]|uniref:Uncharacterized protein n=1 Tax=Citrus clementina TaxID=85681 RepID=V4SRS2_CITCL|nr:hypothetical protein CICLE_v10033988mg [Citrus x clementina]
MFFTKRKKKIEVALSSIKQLQVMGFVLMSYELGLLIFLNYLQYKWKGISSLQKIIVYFLLNSRLTCSRFLMFEGFY